MLILQAFKDMWDESPTNPDIKKYLESKRKEMGDMKFTDYMLYWFGGRSYNRFLDYSLLAIKFADWYRKHDIKAISEKEDAHQICRDIVTHLLWDDRHDMYQNIPYYLDDLDLKEDFYEYFAKAVIDCFNIDGTKDISVTFGLGG